MKAHYEENESDFNSCPSVNFVNLVSRLAQHAPASAADAALCAEATTAAMAPCACSWRLHCGGEDNLVPFVCSLKLPR